ncbi:transcriptional activator FtrA [Aquisphaera giovannonii]|uniref:Transcriptional activator FtrA n=1 Tax=Aquisphaera giovannonii TaxID=406548 RepID=A0A5B9VW33_9BACT|nr:helix-turn-helix domain-containing protein [Aquisphaera giovannonii]QEH31995.1 transcriptional activator FtrA [Aquisphaera giovannonii]
MIHTLAPRGPLAGLIERVWLDDAFERPHRAERILPGGSLDLIANLTPGTDPAILAAGARAGPFTFHAGGTRTVLGVAFRPGGAAPFLGVPADEIRDAIVPLRELWGPEADALSGRLASAGSPGARLAEAERTLLGRLARSPRRHPGVAMAVEILGDGTGGPPVAAVARRVGLGPRRLSRAFQAEVGLPPKLYARIRRFGEVLRLAASASRVEWAAVAQACGYYDQAHLIRDFRAFAGMSPTEYLAMRGGLANPHHLPEPS